MRRFNSTISEVLEAVEAQQLAPQSERVNTSDRGLIAQTLEQLKSGRLRPQAAAKILRHTATTTKESKPLNILADFMAILGQSTQTGSVLNPTALTKLARTLQVKEGALDHLDEGDRALAIRLIQQNYKEEATRSRSGSARVRP